MLWIIIEKISLQSKFDTKEDDTEESIEQVIDNDVGEELHLKKIAEQEDDQTVDADADDQPAEQSSRKFSPPLPQNII